ncbi:MAG: helix-turn-helix domain-containing protein [Chloroflexota bacterium]
MRDVRVSEIGPELRRRRVAARLSQAALAAPRTRAYISAVENGRVVPSVPALAALTARLGVGLGEFFSSVETSRLPTLDRAVLSANGSDEGGGPST